MQVDELRALRRLAAAMLTLAAKDFRNPHADRETRNEAAKFLTRETVWHSLSGIHPDQAARWLRRQIEGTKRWD